MEAIRRIERITGDKLVINMPTSFLGKQVEIIVLSVDEDAVSESQTALPAKLKHSVTITDDLLKPATDAAEWEASLDRTARQIAGDPDAFR